MSTELQPLVDAEIAVEANRNPVDEKKISTLLTGLPGVQDTRMYGGLIVLQYDPESTTKATIREKLTENGVHVLWMKAAPASPVTDAIHPAASSGRRE